jgi:hypothetical protein
MDILAHLNNIGIQMGFFCISNVKIDSLGYLKTRISCKFSKKIICYLKGSNCYPKGSGTISEGKCSVEISND